MPKPFTSAAVPDQATFSLNGFFTRLQNAGFQLRPDDYAEVLQVLTTFSPEKPDELVELIAPLIVTSEEEQQRFYALFAEHQRTGATVVVEPPETLAFWQLLRQLGWYWLIPVFVLLCAFGWYQFVYVPPPTLASVPDTTTTSTPIANKAATTSRYLSIVSSSGSVVQASRLNPYHIWVPLLLALLCAGGAGYLFRRTRQRPHQAAGLKDDALTSRFTSKRPPYGLPLPNRERELVLPSRAFDAFVTTLRQRNEDEVTRLNVSRTLAATVRSGGLPELIFSHQLREDEFLFLIDTSRVRGQQLHLFEFLFRALSRESVCVERFFYQVPFGLFHNERFPNGLRLAELANQYPASNLVIWGDGYPLLFDDYDILNPAFLDGLRRWERRAILTPVPFPDWDHRERALQSEFLVLPADVAGQLRLMQALRDNQPDQTAYLNARTDLYSTADINFKSVAELRAYLGDDLFQWLCATAVYGKVRWEVLIEMGRAILPDPVDVSIPNLLKLARITWLRDGNFPDAVRLELLKALRPDNELKARRTLLDLLYFADVQYPDGYFFDEERYLLRTTNQFVIYTYRPDQYPNYEPAARMYEQLWQGNQLPDGTMRMYLDNPSKDWDNLLGTGPSRVRLTDQFATDVPPPVRPERRWAYALAGIAVVVLVYIGFQLWQKPEFAKVSEPVTYTFVFRPNQCLSLVGFQRYAVVLKPSLEDRYLKVIQFKDTTVSVTLPSEEIQSERAVLGIMNSNSTWGDTVHISQRMQRHVFEVRGADCAPVIRDRVEIFYNQSNIATTKYLADKVAEALAKEDKYTIIQSPLSKQSAAKYNVSQNEIRYDNENDPEYKTALELQKTIRTNLANEAGQLNFSLVRVMKQKTPHYISIFIVGNSSNFRPCPPNCPDPDKLKKPSETYQINNLGQRIEPLPPANSYKEGETCPPICRDESGRLLTGTRSTTASSVKKALVTTTTGNASPAQETKQPAEQTTTPAQKTFEAPVPLATAPGFDWVMIELLQYQSSNGTFKLVGEDANSIVKYNGRLEVYMLPNFPSTRQTPLISFKDVIGDIKNHIPSQVEPDISVKEIERFDQLEKPFNLLWSTIPGWEAMSPPKSDGDKKATIWVGVFAKPNKATTK